MGLFGTPDLEVVGREEVQANIPGWYEDPLRRTIGAAERVAEEEYMPYGGPRIAEPSSDLLQAYENIRGNLSGYTGPLAESMDLARQAGAPLSAGDISGYMSPYMQSVIDQTKRETTRDYDIRKAAANRALGTTGAFGGSRHAIREAEGERNLTRNLADIQERGLQSAYDRALATAEKDRMAAFRGSEALGQLSGAELSRLLQAEGARESMGRSLMGIDQSNLDLAYQDFITQRDWPKSQVGWFSNILHGVPQQVIGQSSTKQQPGTSTLSQLFGLGVGLFGGKEPIISGSDIGGAIDWVDDAIGGVGDWLGLAEGGEVKGYAGGGDVDYPTMPRESGIDWLSEVWNLISPVPREQVIRAPGETLSSLKAGWDPDLASGGGYGFDEFTGGTEQQPLDPLGHLRPPRRPAKLNVEQKGPLAQAGGPKTITDKVEEVKARQKAAKEKLSPIQQILKNLDTKLGKVDPTKRLNDARQMNTWLAALAMMDPARGKDPLAAIASGIKTGLTGYQADKARIMQQASGERKEALSEAKVRADAINEARKARAAEKAANMRTGGKFSDSLSMVRGAYPNLPSEAQYQLALLYATTSKQDSEQAVRLKALDILANTDQGFTERPELEKNKLLDSFVKMVMRVTGRPQGEIKMRKINDPEGLAAKGGRQVR